jgi:UDP-N-acetylglucosamine 2-epimerase (non-hydrolysing)
MWNLGRGLQVVAKDPLESRQGMPAVGKPVLVMRQGTERPEAVEAGGVKIIGTDAGRIVAESERLLNDAELYQRMSRRLTPYGDGHASERIVRLLLERLMQGGSSLGRLGLSIDLEPIGLRHKPSPSPRS